MIHHRKPPILYVDDTVEQRYAMRRILETEGFRVLEAGTGREALALLGEHPSLAVVDVRLPDINGYELTKKIKHHLPHIPVLQVSASFSDPDLRASGFSGGADAYIAQPVHPAELIALVRRILQTSEIEESLRFLARFGAQLGSTLSLDTVSANIAKVIVPYFADRFMMYIRSYPRSHPGRLEPFWSASPSSSEERKTAVIAQSQLVTPDLSDNRFLLIPLIAGNETIGSVAFMLEENREYESADRAIALDLASRIALAVQNCLLLAQEQTTRAALIQSEKLATAGRMSAAIAHEINNPLEALTNLMYILEHSPEATESIRFTAQAASSEIARMAHIARQTLGFYRELRAPSKINLSESVTDTLTFYRKRFADNEIAVKTDLSDKAEIQGIRGEIRQVISNLLTNAIEASEPGGQVRIATFEKEGSVVLRIEDNGLGISGEAIPRIFEAFYTTKQGTGTGLGLWITQSIVEKHAGTIQVSSPISPTQRGTCFTLKFPQGPAPA